MSEFKIQPLADRVIVQPKLPDEKTSGGIILPDTAKEKPAEGTVVAVGSGHFESGKLIDMSVKIGDNVIYSKYGGSEIKVEGSDYLIMSESDILGIVN